MAKAVFAARHTFAFAAGFLLAVMVMFLTTMGRLPPQDAASIVFLSIVVMLWMMLEGALFSLGCAWGGVQRLPQVGWALIAGLLSCGGLIALIAHSNTLPEPVDLESQKLHYTYSMIRTLYVLIAPIIAGLLCAWLSRRGQRLGVGDGKG